MPAATAQPHATGPTNTVCRQHTGMTGAPRHLCDAACERPVPGWSRITGCLSTVLRV
jgi:hypothetical protein